ncbi:MAG: NADH-quinone oxidoreductase subunit L [Cyclobacteriaceae bacterium]
MTLLKTIWPLIFIIPLFSGIIGGLNDKQSLKLSSFGIAFGLFLTLILVWVLDEPLILEWKWLESVKFGFSIDRLNALLVLLVYLITLLVQVFSITYMEHDPDQGRYTAKLGFFAFSMIGLLMSNQLVTLFLFWELVGMSSYLLIGFWYQEAGRSKAARQAFMINRVADAFLLLGVIQVFNNGYATSFTETLASGIQWDGFTGICFIIGAFGKSAQFPFYGWLTKAMAGPTPVSALIHAATMVTAGVYLLVRISPALMEWNLQVIAIGGAVTAFMAAVAALTQFDIKKVLAYSTISQLGYMILGIGVGAYQASVFHLWTHAFFKAGLFLAAGSVIHYMHELDTTKDPQDMRNMGGLQKILPVTFYAFLICGLALSGLPFLSGFLSKEGILTGSWLWGQSTGNYLVPILAFCTAGLTAFYIGRQILLVFFGETSFAKKMLEPLVTIQAPLIFLAASSLWFWNAINPIDPLGWFWNGYLFADLGATSDQHSILGVLIGSIVLTLSGLGVAYWLFRPEAEMARGFKKSNEPVQLAGKISFHGWYIEKFYDQIVWLFSKVVFGAGWFDKKVIDRFVDGVGVTGVVIAKVIGWFDQNVVDGLVNFMASISQLIGRFVTSFQSPKIQIQIGWLLLTLLVLLLWFQYLT